MKVAENRIGEPRSQMKAHSEEIVRAYGRWLESTPPRPRFKGLLLIEYRMPGAAAFYMANEQTLLNPLALPAELENLKEGLKGHVGAENWKRWETLTVEVNSHLNAVASAWKEIGDRLATAASRAGLFAQSGPTESLVDTYWPELFVSSIWNEPEYYQEKKVHSWESATIVEDQVTISQRHVFDTLHTWIFANSNMVRSQNKEPVEMMKRSWEEEALRAEPVKRSLLTERARIQENAKGLQALLRNLQADYAKTSRLSGVCPTCEAWQDKVNPLPQKLGP